MSDFWSNIADAIQGARGAVAGAAQQAQSRGSSGGGRGYSGGGSSRGGGSSGSDKDEKKLSLKELAAQYGYAAAFFSSDAELERLIKKAVKEQWSTARFQAEFMNTKWYQSHNASARSWIELEARDPSEAQKRVNDQISAIRQQANQMGISLSWARAKKMARESLMMGWTGQTLTNAIVAEFEYEPGRTSGATATLETFVKQNAHDYGVKLSDGRVGSLLTKLLRGDWTEDHVMDMVKDMALARYPGMEEYLNRGLTVADVAENYRQSYANLLEVSYDSVSLFDPLVQKALQGTRQGAKSSEPPQMQSLYDFERTLREDSRWQYTKNAKKATMDATIQVLKDWGLYS